jgi:hypothetical protein
MILQTQWYRGNPLGACAAPLVTTPEEASEAGPVASEASRRGAASAPRIYLQFYFSFFVFLSVNLFNQSLHILLNFHQKDSNKESLKILNLSLL